MHPNAGGLCTQLLTLLGLCALSCRAFPKNTNYRCEYKDSIHLWWYIRLKVLHLLIYISSLQKPWSTYHGSTKQRIIFDAYYKIKALYYPQSPKIPCDEYIFTSSAWSAPSSVGSFTQNLDQVGPCPIGPQHSHMTHPESLSFSSLDICCEPVVHYIVLLDHFCHKFFFLAHLLQ